jgi:hypothetical protein
MSQQADDTRRSRTGYHRFVPTTEQRDNVEALTGYGIPHEEICRLVINPRTGRPIDDKTLRFMSCPPPHVAPVARPGPAFSASAQAAGGIGLLRKMRPASSKLPMR